MADAGVRFRNALLRCEYAAAVSVGQADLLPTVRRRWIRPQRFRADAGAERPDVLCAGAACEGSLRVDLLGAARAGFSDDSAFGLADRLPGFVRGGVDYSS